jgi:glycosyltransferase involved in cell wall biosynthesis
MEAKDVNIILVLMVKNESHIIARCLESAFPFVDAILLADTGSADDTVKVAVKCADQAGKAFGTVLDPWQDFGHNRTLSLQAARKFAEEDLRWKLQVSFALVLDADMQLRGDPVFLRKFLTDFHGSGLLLQQRNGGLEYSNMRVMRLSDAWFCEGVTHEYWTGGGEARNIPAASMWIDDIGDGGAKLDKFERDERLLLAGLEKKPGCERYMFYLAQTYHCMNRDLDAIHWYKKRIFAGGWVEEIWYSHLMIARTYLRMKLPFKAELWVHLGQQIQPDRAEGLLSLVTHFRETSQHFKAWHYLLQLEALKKPQETKLFLEVDAYGHKMAYERSILQYYVYPDAKADGAMCSLSYEGPMEHSVMSNLTFYVENLRDVAWTRLDFAAPEGYASSSVAVNAEGLMCVRTVSYRINEAGDYHMPSGLVETRNFSARWLSDSRSWEDWAEVVPAEADAARWRREDYIRGLEDVRLCGDTFTATTREFSYCASNRMVHGKFPEMTFVPVRPPRDENACEKNWLPIDDHRVIYGWEPFEVGDVVLQEDGTARLITETTIATPRWFRHLRGSCPPIAVDDDCWILTHIVSPRKPRHYLHVWVVLDRFTMVPKAHTPPFRFRHQGIEYCLGGIFVLKEGVPSFQLFVSVWDRESWCCEVPVAVFKKSLRTL